MSDKRMTELNKAFSRVEGIEEAARDARQLRNHQVTLGAPNLK